MPVRTDLALECREMLTEEINGVESSRQNNAGVNITHVKVTTPEGAAKLGKPVGNYITIEIDGMHNEDEDICERGAEAVCAELRKLIDTSKKEPVLVAGLGNRYITPDSIGPKAVSKLVVTRHITEGAAYGYSFDVRSVSAIAPGVLGLTGIESSEMIKAIVDKVKPSLVIAIDALASRKLSRLGTTVQLCDTGISPGSGVGNNRKELSRETLGVRVIAIGVPMVVDAATMTVDVIESLSRFADKNYGGLKEIEQMLKAGDYAFIGEALSENNENMIVTPNDVDVISEQAAKIIAEGINRALHLV